MLVAIAMRCPSALVLGTVCTKPRPGSTACGLCRWSGVWQPPSPIPSPNGRHVRLGRVISQH